MGKSVDYGDDFEAFWTFWRTHLRRLGDDPKAAAFNIWQKAIKINTPQELLTAARNYAEARADKVGTEFIPMASTWLAPAKRRWEQYLQPLEKSPAQEIAKTGHDYEWLAGYYARTGTWLGSSPAPGYRGCPLPGEIATRHGIDLTTGRRAKVLS